MKRMKLEGSRMTKLLIRHPGKGEGDDDVDTSLPDMMPFNIYT